MERESLEGIEIESSSLAAISRFETCFFETGKQGRKALKQERDHVFRWEKRVFGIPYRANGKQMRASDRVRLPAMCFHGSRTLVHKRRCSTDSALVSRFQLHRTVDWFRGTPTKRRWISWNRSCGTSERSIELQEQFLRTSRAELCLCNRERKKR